jgi:hypothetical protein
MTPRYKRTPLRQCPASRLALHTTLAASRLSRRAASDGHGGLLPSHEIHYGESGSLGGPFSRRGHELAGQASRPG